MKRLSIREMRAELGTLGELVEKAGEIVITRRGKPIARVLPIRPRLRPSHARLRRSLPRSGKPSQELIRADRNAR